MAEYIEREALLKALNNDILKEDGCPIFVAATVDQIVSLAPTADVEPVRHGCWKYSHTTTMDHMAIVKCSNCGHEAFAIAFYVKDGHYCPICGARMDGG